MNLGAFCDYFWIIMGSFWDDFGIILESFWHHFGIMLGSCWDHFGLSLGSVWDHVGTVFEAVWDEFRAIYGQLFFFLGKVKKHIWRKPYFFELGTFTHLVFRSGGGANSLTFLSH